MATVVLVHGIAQEQLAAAKLEQAWVPALAGGVANFGDQALADRIWRAGTSEIDIRMRRRPSRTRSPTRSCRLGRWRRWRRRPCGPVMLPRRRPSPARQAYTIAASITDRRRQAEALAAVAEEIAQSPELGELFEIVSASSAGHVPLLVIAELLASRGEGRSEGPR